MQWSDQYYHRHTGAQRRPEFVFDYLYQQLYSTGTSRESLAVCRPCRKVGLGCPCCHCCCPPYCCCCYTDASSLGTEPDLTQGLRTVKEEDVTALSLEIRAPGSPSVGSAEREIMKPTEERLGPSRAQTLLTLVKVDCDSCYPCSLPPPKSRLPTKSKPGAMTGCPGHPIAEACTLRLGAPMGLYRVFA